MSTKTTINWIIFFITTSLLTSITPLSTAYTVEGPEFAIACLRYVFVITIFQSAFLYIAHLLGGYIFAILFSLSITINAFNLNLLFFNSVNRLDTPYLAIIFSIATIAITYIALPKIKEGKLPTLKVYLICATIFITPAIISEPWKSDTNSGDTGIIDSNYWSSIHLNSRPNIYLLSFDSLIPYDVANNYIGINESYYNDIFFDGFTTIQRGVNFNHSTVTSLNATMQLNQASQPQSAHLFTGYHSSVLETIFHANGYRVVTGYARRMHGEIGTHVDEYLSIQGMPINSTKLCIDSLGSTLLEMRFHFMCNAYERIIQNSLLDKILFDRTNSIENIEGDSMPLEQNEWFRLMLEHIANTSHSNTPTISFFYTYRPIGHTISAYHHDDKASRDHYKQYFTTGLEQLAQQIAEIRKSILENDPFSVVLIFGDHGAHLSTGMAYSDDNHFILDDRFRVLHAFMKTKNHCSEHPTDYYTKEYATTSRLILDTIDCLSDSYTHNGDILSFREKPELVKKIFIEHGG